MSQKFVTCQNRGECHRLVVPHLFPPCKKCLQGRLGYDKRSVVVESGFSRQGEVICTPDLVQGAGGLSLRTVMVVFSKLLQNYFPVTVYIKIHLQIYVKIILRFQ